MNSRSCLLALNAFAMNCVAHQSPGLWTHPRDRTADYNRLPYWTDLAKTLERGRFDGLFLADEVRVLNRPVFRFWHKTYLWVSTAQWVAAVLLAALTLAAWRAEDRRSLG